MRFICACFSSETYSSERDYGTLKLEPYVLPKPIRFCWYNVYAWLDRISGHLDFYQVDRQESRSYVNPFSAHMSYWNDSRFYRIVLEWFDEG